MLVVAGHALSRQPTSWRSALAILQLQRGQAGQPLARGSQDPMSEVLDELDQLRKRRLQEMRR